MYLLILLISKYICCIICNYFYDTDVHFLAAPVVEPQSTTVPVLVESDVTSRTMTIRTPVVRDNRGEIRYILSLNDAFFKCMK